MLTLEPPECDALLFDCDGTLADSFRMHYSVIRRVLATYNVDFDETWYRLRVGLSSADLLAAVAQRWNVIIGVNEFEQLRAPFYEVAIEHVREIVPVVAVARQHLGRLPLAVVSGGSRQLVERTLSWLKIRDYFSLVVTVDDVRHGKPAPDLYELAARQLNVSPARCVVYEDTEEGLAAARAAGMHAIDVRPFIHEALLY